MFGRTTWATDIVVIPLGLLYKPEAVPHVEVVRSAELEDTYSHGLGSDVCFAKDDGQGCGAKTSGLEVGMNVQVIKENL
jgi:hypothetical protein